MTYPTYNITDLGDELMDKMVGKDKGYHETLSAIQYNILSNLRRHGPTKCNIMREMIASWMPKDVWVNNMDILESKGLVTKIIGE